MNVANLKIGEKGIIKKVNGAGALRHRLLEMGIIPGTSVTLSKIAPLGDPLQIQIRGYELSIRKDDAILIEIEEALK